MSWQLINHLRVPPGEYIYRQTEGIERLFRGTPDINIQANSVATFRKANGLPRATFDEAMEDIVQYTCQRIGGHKNWCYEVRAAFADASPILRVRKKGGCSSCGAKVR